MHPASLLLPLLLIPCSCGPVEEAPDDPGRQPAGPEEGLEASERTRVLADLAAIWEACQVFFVLNGRWPDELGVLVAPDASGNSYLDRAGEPRDPWGNEYLLTALEGGGIDIVSHGADGLPGGEGEDADLRLSDLDER